MTRAEVEVPLAGDENWSPDERWARKILIDFWKAQDAEQVAYLVARVQTVYLPS